MSKHNEHVVAIVLEPVKLGHEFVDWPLHITVVPWFPCDDEKKLDKLLAEIADETKTFEVEAGQVEMFGSQRNVEVNLVKDNDLLTKLHWSVLNSLENNGFGIHQKEFVGNGYRAHITVQKKNRATEGQRFEAKSFALVQQVRLKKTGTMVKTITKEYRLK